MIGQFVASLVPVCRRPRGAGGFGQEHTGTRLAPIPRLKKGGIHGLYFHSSQVINPLWTDSPACVTIVLIYRR